MNTDHDKYLVLRIPSEESAGLNHILSIIKGAIIEAIHLKRVLVIDKYTMLACHNLGHTLRNLDIERYINLGRTKIYKTENNGSIEQINDAFRYLRMENFDGDKYPEELVLRLSSMTPISEAQNNKYKVIVRTTRSSFYNRLYSDVLIVVLYPSDKVAHLTDIVLRAMGTSLSDTEKRSDIYKGVDYASNSDKWQHTVLDSPLHYACLHLRGNDAAIFPHHKQAASASHIRSIIKQKMPKGMRIYIMTDITKPGYMSFLEKDYIVYRYYDFPELKNLVSGDKSSVDNAMLYSVEKNIMQHAYLRLTGEDRTSKIIHTSCIYKIRWRYQILSVMHKAARNYRARIDRLIGR